MNKVLPPVHHKDKKWNGYSLSELRFQRALTLVRMDIAQERLHHATQRFDSRLNSVVTGNIFLRLMSNLNIAEYAAIAIRTVRTAVRFWRRIKS